MRSHIVLKMFIVINLSIFLFFLVSYRINEGDIKLFQVIIDTYHSETDHPHDHQVGL